MLYVVIPVYNAVQFLDEAVNSVLTQPCKEINIVLVNDGSTDGSAQLCDEIAAKENRVSVIHQENKGVSAAHNAGIEYLIKNNLEGYVAFLDSDDLWLSDVITEDMAYELRQMKQTDVFVFGGINSNEDCSRFSVPNRYRKETSAGGNGVIWKVQGHFSANIYIVYRCFVSLELDSKKVKNMLRIRFLLCKICFLQRGLHSCRKPYIFIDRQPHQP